MKQDLSYRIYLELYVNMQREVEVVLKNNKKITGVITGYFKGDVDSGESYISRWCIDNLYAPLLNFSDLNFSHKQIINHHDIKKIKLVLANRIFYNNKR